ncbi:glycosyltransferase family 4 protein [Candidatus Sumerlaeota bacterium]|nr:glycosyltransferase family 4 protein [Candidatus Sumerlaeota bacterium]
MNILILNHNLRERGTYFRAQEIARGLHARGHDVTFVGTGHGYYRPRKVDEAERWLHWETANWSALRGGGEGFSHLGQLQRYLLFRKKKWDFIYTFSHTPVDQGSARMLRRDSTFWMTDWCDLWNSEQGGLHDTRYWSLPLPMEMSGIRGRLMRASFRAEDAMEERAAIDADAVSIIVEPMRLRTRELSIPDDRVLHLVSGADTRRIDALDRDECRKKLQLPHDRLIIGYVANVTPDTEQLVGAMKIVWEKIPDVMMISVGPRWYQETDVIGEAKRAGKLIDYGFRPFAEVPQFLGASDLLVMPIRDLPFNRCRWPNKFGDYMASGRATASCTVGDMGRIIKDYDVGRAGEPAAYGLAQGILELAENRALRERCGVNARTAAEQNFSWQGQLDRLVGFLKGRGLDL